MRRRQLRRWSPGLLLSSTLVALVVGASLHVSGVSPTGGDRMWMAAGALGAAFSLWMTVEGLRAGRFGVDVIALLALIGASAVGEYLASAVVAVMVTSGRTLETWAAGRAHRDLKALLQRAPTVAHRYEDGTLRTVSVDQLDLGDQVLVGTGELVAADGNLLCDAVLDESALTDSAWV